MGWLYYVSMEPDCLLLQRLKVSQIFIAHSLLANGFCLRLALVLFIMVASSAALAFRSAGLRARALPLAQRSSICYSRAAVKLQSSLRYYSSGTKPETAEKAKEAVKETAETAKDATKEIKDAPKEAPAPAPASAPKKGGRRSKKLFRTSLALALLVGLVYGLDTRASIHRYAVPPLIRLLYPDAEEAHHFTVETLKQLHRFGLNPRERGNPDGDGALATEVCFQKKKKKEKT